MGALSDFLRHEFETDREDRETKNGPLTPANVANLANPCPKFSNFSSFSSTPEPIFDPARLQAQADRRNREAATRGDDGSVLRLRPSRHLRLARRRRARRVDMRRVRADKGAGMTRLRLPNRRPGETIGFEFRGAAYTATFSRFPDGRLAELFIDAAKPSNDAADDARDAAVCLSLALQFGTA